MGVSKIYFFKQKSFFLSEAKNFKEISIFLRKSLKKLVILVNLESFWRCRNTKIIRKHSSKPPKFSRLRRAILSTVLYPQINRGTQCRSTCKILLTLSCAFLHLRKLRSASFGPQIILRIVEARSYSPENSENRIRAVYKSFCE